MDPDVFVTIAFSGYAVLAALAIVTFLRAGHEPDADSDDDAR